jgi:hypothetical protein
MAEQPGSDDLAELIDYELPGDWEQLPPSGDRLVNLQPAGDPESSCYLSFLGGIGGGLEDNVNRWRNQFGLDPVTGDEVAALPKFTIFGREGTLVELSGSFQGMQDARARPGFRLLGLMVCEPSGSLFLKFVGPAALVEAEREAFLALAGSLRVAQDHAHSEGDGHEHGAEPAGGTPDGALTWVAPPGWTQAAPRAMREVTFTLGAGAECYVTRLGPDAGDLRSNLDRWRDQFGLAPLADEELAALERVTMFGAKTPLLELAGHYTGMSGKAVQDQAFLGVALFRAQDSLFVRLTGSPEVVRAERAHFIAFVGSLKEGP